MAEKAKHESKKFNITYAVVAVISFILVAAGLITYYYVSHFIMFSPEKVARQYILNRIEGDGYDALKYSNMSVKQKMGDYLRENYINQYVKEPGKDEKLPVLTAEEEGEKLTLLLDTMYPIYQRLESEYGYENFDEFFSEYFKSFADVYKNIYGHDYMTDEEMFACIEGNLALSIEESKLENESNIGKGKEYAEKYLGKNKTVTEKELEESPYMSGYLIDVQAKDAVIRDDRAFVEEYIGNLSDSAKKKYESFGIDFSDIKAIATVEVNVTVSGEGDQEIIKNLNEMFKESPFKVKLIKIGSQWYVDIAK